MYNTGFKFLNEKKIDLLFGQLPRIYQTKSEFKYSKFDKNLRDNLNFQKFLKKKMIIQTKISLKYST